MNKARNPKNPANRRPGALDRERVLSLWHRVDLRPLEKAAAHTERKAGEVLSRVLKEIRIDRRRSESEIARVWNHLIDPNVVKHAQPTGLRNGTLFVTVDNSVWLSELVRYRYKEILERLQNSFGRECIARISFRVG